MEPLDGTSSDCPSPNTLRKQKRLGPAPIASFEDIQENRVSRK